MIARGFSLIELVMVIAIVGVLGLVAIIYAPSIDNTRLDAAAKQVVSDIEFAKQNASLTGVISGVNFVSGGAYTVYQGTTATPLASPLTLQSMVVTLSAKYPNIVISSNFTVEFDSLGSPTTGAGGSVTLSNGSATKTITVTANTGKLVLQ
jgi:prepilin-type N-terminal cleavage/methylation domain-containing protein